MLYNVENNKDVFDSFDPVNIDLAFYDAFNNYVAENSDLSDPSSNKKY